MGQDEIALRILFALWDNPDQGPAEAYKKRQLRGMRGGLFVSGPQLLPARFR